MQFTSHLCLLCFFSFSPRPLFFSSRNTWVGSSFCKKLICYKWDLDSLWLFLSILTHPQTSPFGLSPLQSHSICVPIAKGWDWATIPSLQFLNPNDTENHKVFHNSLFGTTCCQLSIGYLYELHVPFIVNMHVIVNMQNFNVWFQLPETQLRVWPNIYMHLMVFQPLGILSSRTHLPSRVYRICNCLISWAASFFNLNRMII